ncbi:uncharacterized protein LOC124162203 [Ischnura elegans]|uniref:uncharacterized protein LOC124162203 n=1 Tax=Ischnura elegans TaxID=197161 RepID=UPI001ED8B672|nr:uncharacterized protein LOC124162203 [Ischnura elegans]XP_046394606.1 uncharacterized protein LOC124162203 [Ischnura elegans]
MENAKPGFERALKRRAEKISSEKSRLVAAASKVQRWVQELRRNEREEFINEERSFSSHLESEIQSDSGSANSAEFDPLTSGESEQLNPQISSENSFDNIESHHSSSTSGGYSHLPESQFSGINMPDQSFKKDGSNGNMDEAGIFHDEDDKVKYLLESLRKWGSSGVPMRKIDELLFYLKPLYPILPSSYKTLFNTPKSIPIKSIGNGKLWYRGIRESLNKILTWKYLHSHQEIIIDINIDGLPLHTSSRTEFWPILGCLAGKYQVPFPITVFCGKGKPENLNMFLNDFVKEAGELMEGGYEYDGRIFPFRIRHYILDAPARAFVKQCKGHTGYAACEKCTVIGEWVEDRVTYAELNCPLRTDESFQRRDQLEHHLHAPGADIDDHDNGEWRTPLEQIGTGMVSQFRLDSFHLVYGGVFKRLVGAWILWPGPWKLNRNAFSEISDKLVSIKSCFPCEFNRPPRNLQEWKLYKGTEWRRLLCYDGMLVFKHRAFNVNIYKQFLLLHCAIFILASPYHVQQNENIEKAEELLEAFIKHCASTYGKRFISYNVHSLKHLGNECREHGALEEFSTFKFENKLKSLKESLRSGHKPLQQLAFRELQRDDRKKILSEPQNDVKLIHKLKNPFEDVPGIQYKKLKYHRITYNTKRKYDSCCRTKSGDIIIIKNIVHSQEGKVILVGNKFLWQDDFYHYPLNSSKLGILKVNRLDGRTLHFDFNDVQSKCVLLPDDDDGFLCIPLLHSF